MSIVSRLLKLLKKTTKIIETKQLRNSIVNLNHSVLSIGQDKIDYRKKGFSLIESNLFSLGKNNYKEYVTTWESYQPRLADNRYFNISDDKYLFSLVFRNYINTPKTICLIHKGAIISLGNTVHDMDSLIDWIYRNNGCVIKDRYGSDGFQVYVISMKDNKMVFKNTSLSSKDLAEIINKLPNGIIQERISQSSYSANLYKESVNTIRIVTIRQNNGIKHEVVGALQRIGTNASAPVDNFNQGGLSALIDLETGMLGKASSGNSTDSEGNRSFYSRHPDTGGQIEGVIVPNWNEIKNKLVEVTMQLPFFDYIAWDVVVLDNGFSIIETNMKSSLNVFQIHGGQRNLKLGEAYREHGWLVNEKDF